MTTLKQLHDAMWSYNQSVAYGSECAGWQDFVADSFRRFGMAPWADETGKVEVPQDFESYWLLVAEIESEDYDATGASRNV